MPTGPGPYVMVAVFDNSDWALSPGHLRPSGRYAPTHDVAPSAVRIAVAIDAINCTINFAVSFLLITHLLPDVSLQRMS